MLGSYIEKCNKSLRGFIQAHPRYDRALIFRPGLAKLTENAYLRFVSDMWEMSLCAKNLRPGFSANLLIQMLVILDADDVPILLVKENHKFKM